LARSPESHTHSETKLLYNLHEISSCSAL
jgi:hypothetical protein